MNIVKLNSGSSLQSFLASVVEEGVKSALAQKALSEKEKQLKLGGTGSEGGDSSGGGEGADEDDLFGSGDDDESGEGGEGDATSKTIDSDTEDMGDGEVKTKDAVDMLNSIRSGKSFKDEKVAAAFDEYFSSLSDPEKKSLKAFLKGIAQIVTGGIPGNQAAEPGDDAKVQMQQKPQPVQGEKTKSIRPNVIKGGGKKAPGSDLEDTAGPAPITPKRR
jgi:hypothetical protein